MVVSDAFLRRAAEGGLRIREYAALPGGSVKCTVTEDDDLLIGRMVGDFSRATRVDISVCNEQGIEQVRVADIPVRTSARSVAFHHDDEGRADHDHGHAPHRSGCCGR